MNKQYINKRKRVFHLFRSLVSSSFECSSVQAERRSGDGDNFDNQFIWFLQHQLTLNVNKETIHTCILPVAGCSVFIVWVILYSYNRPTCFNKWLLKILFMLVLGRRIGY